jgi:outer membrane receptor for ferrienterochelin and colicin
VQGIEIDGMVALTDELTLNMAFAWLDAEYKSFPDAGCTSIQTAIFAAGPDGIAGTGDDLTPGNCTQDLSGQALQFAAEYSGNLGLTYSRQLNNDLELKAGIDVMFTDDYDTAADGDSNLAQDAFTKVNARIGLMDYDGRWSVALLGKNLTDETTTTWGNDIPLGNFGFADSYFQIVDAPRSYELQVKVSF